MNSKPDHLVDGGLQVVCFQIGVKCVQDTEADVLSCELKGHGSLIREFKQRGVYATNM